LQHRRIKTLSRGAARRRQVLKWIASREAWLKEHSSKRKLNIEVLAEDVDPDNADRALLLGIAERDMREYPHDRHNRLLLRPWAVQAALSRPGGRSL